MKGEDATISWRDETTRGVGVRLFLAGVIRFFLCRVLLTKEKVVCTTLCMTYVVKMTENTHNIMFLEGVLSSYDVRMYYFLWGNTISVVFSE